MIKRPISILLLPICLLTPAAISAQTKTDKSWNVFWAQFSRAVNQKNKAGIKRLMASDREFSSGGGSENRDQWLALVGSQGWWGILQKSVRLGTKSYDYGGKPARVTKNDHLIFAFTGGRWRFMGPMGD